MSVKKLKQGALRYNHTIERYVKQYQQVGIQFAIHGNSGKAPPNKTPVSIKKAVQALIKDKYFDLNLLHLAEQLAENENIVVKRETLRGRAHDIHHVKRAKRRRSNVRKRRERMHRSAQEAFADYLAEECWEMKSGACL